LTDPFLAAQQDFGAMMLEEPSSGPLRAVLWQYAADNEAHAALTWEFQHDVLSLSGQLWLWFEIVFDDWPVKLLRMIDKRRSNRDERARELWNDPRCNKSRFFALKLMDLYSSWQDMFNDANLVAALANWGYKTKLTGMHAERMFGSHQGIYSMEGSPCGALAECRVSRPMAAAPLARLRWQRPTCSYAGTTPRCRSSPGCQEED